MRAEIISIGTELLVGSILNTNARFLSQALAEHAVDVYHQMTVGDNIDRIIGCLKTAAERSEIIVTSGGLGPTEDDVTTRAVSRFLGKPLLFHAPTYRYIRQRLKKRALAMNPLTATQCHVPKEAKVLENSMGTAPGTLSGFDWEGQKRWLLVLPGPPRELEPLFRKAWPLLAKLAKIKKEHFEIRPVHLAGVLESQVAQKVTDLLKRPPPVTVGIYAKPQEVELKIMAKAPSKPKAMKLADRMERTIRKRLKEKVFGVNRESLSVVVGNLLRKRKATLAAAESCTGGLFSNFVTDTAGSSVYFAGGIVAYSNRIKQSALKVNGASLRKLGAVSAPVAREMAKNVKLLFQTDFGVGITGIAGPGGGSAKKPAGLVYIAITGPRRTRVTKNLFLGDRATIKKSAALKALDLLRLELENHAR
ncbi:MAG: competence/damage-inducible protein A [Omnitrophica bacterium RIFCSPHIGHO2_02_FULL_51_18]|nr:MAG: competence/damage-inducible protein A [Omnitrophica bacterium RIFCSPHIGHO2_02_FULL_51_18]